MLRRIHCLIFVSLECLERGDKYLRQLYSEQATLDDVNFFFWKNRFKVGDPLLSMVVLHHDKVIIIKQQIQ